MPRSRHSIAVILPVEPEYSNRLLEGAIEYASEHPELKLIEIPYVRSMGPPLPDGPPDFDGALLHLGAEETWAHRLIDAGVVLRNTCGDWWGKGIPSLAFNGPRTDAVAFRFLAGLNRRQIAYIGTDVSLNTEFRRRARNFLATAAEHGMETALFELFGRTPGEEINRVKTERAMYYLRSTDLSIDRIARLCGFEQPGKFSKFFKRQTNRTPSDYRKGSS